MTSTTYYRVAPRALDPTLHSDSEATESDSNGKVKRKDVPNGSSTNGQSASSKPRTRTRAATTTNVKRKGRHSASSNGDNSSNSSIINNGAGQSGGRGNKRKPVSGWSDTLSSDSSEDDTRQHASVGRRKINHTHNNQQVSASATKRTRIGSPTARSSSRQKVPARRDSIPNGLKKLPKGYVYDTEINQAALMRLSVNPSQTGEYMRHLRGRNAEENNFPDKRGNYGVDLTQEPSMFALEQQTGYTYPRLRNGGKERLPKGSCEDGYAVADLKQVGGGFLGRLFCITDGHGGSQCSSFVVATIPGAMQVIFGKYKPSDLSIPAVQELVKNQITEAIRLIDKEYLDYKKQQYLRYKEKKLTRDPGSDGTTLIVNIFIGNWIICLNLGDSRTMMGSRDLVGRWNVDFYSEDHTPALERLAQTIYANGGEFVTHDDKVIRFDPTMKNDKKHRQSLKEARIRVKDGESNQYGIPFRTKNGHCASVNLGACIGDVLYKLDPINPVLSCKPDITFIDISEVQQGFLLMASDGLWDYVQRGGKIHDQNATVCQFVGDKLDRGWNHQRIVYTLSDREGAPTGLYSDSIQEYDDFTAILVSFNKQQLHRQQRMHKDYELKQLQILMLHEQQQKQREMERQQELKKLQAQQVLAAEVERLRQEQALLRKAKADRGEGSDSEMETKPKIKPKVNGVAEVVKMESLTAADSVSTLAATTTVAANATAVAAATQISSSSSTVRATSSGGQWHPA
ncbi:Protein phosphatase 1L [Mortierella claussenii]|nr:Protein phosphatase 1L [Mortierella claussenii]